MCGIVGVFSKSTEIEAGLGTHLGAMLAQMCDRGPDSAGIAVYRNPAPPGASKLTLFSADPLQDWDALAGELANAFGGSPEVSVRASHAVFVVDADAAEVDSWVRTTHPELRVMSAGERIEIYKETGRPEEFVRRFQLEDIEGSHPFSTGLDVCLVHNGSLSNHNRLRERLRREGIEFQTENDTEVAAGYIAWRLREGATLDEALDGCLRDLDGFYTFLVGTVDGFAVLRDPIACKPAVLAETDEWVAMASEWRALAVLPGAADATAWEPVPGVAYAWERAKV
jgi:methylamine---glutamate N-methyltransferase subunit A